MPCPKVRREQNSGWSRGMVGRFLHYFPQYTLQDLTDGTLSMGVFFYLWGGLLDNEAPEVTESVEAAVSRRTREAAKAAHADAVKARGM